MCLTTRVTYEPADLIHRSNKLYVKLSRRPVRGKFGVRRHTVLRTGAGETTCRAAMAGGGDAGDDGGDPPHVRRRAGRDVTAAHRGRLEQRSCLQEWQFVGQPYSDLCPTGCWRMRGAP